MRAINEAFSKYPRMGDDCKERIDFLAQHNLTRRLYMGPGMLPPEILNMGIDGSSGMADACSEFMTIRSELESPLSKYNASCRQ
jgi:hypothetical protein